MSIASITTALVAAITNFGKTISNELEYTLKSETITLAYDATKVYTISSMCTAIGIPVAEMDLTTLRTQAIVETVTAGTFVNSEGTTEILTSGTTVTIKNKYPDPLSINVLITVKRKQIL